MSKFIEVDKYSYHECEIHNHGFYLGEQSKQAEIEELKKRIESAMELLEYNEYVDSALQALEILKGGETK